MWPGSFYLEIEPMLSQFLMKKKHDWSTNSPGLQISGESCGKEELRRRYLQLAVRWIRVESILHL
jgi:hypothetical protein